MKNNLFSIGPVTVHGYGLMIGIGFVLCVLMGMHRAKKRSLDSNAAADMALFGIVCGFLGAKLLYLIVEFPRLLEDPLGVLGSEGFVVYGGIIAGVLSAVLYCRIKKLVFLEYFDLLAPSISLAQGFGRIGCFLAGCCYGRETDSFIGVVFPEGSFAPSGVSLIPTQLISSAGNFIITAALILFARRRKHTGDVGALYLLLYGVGRFFVEFLRADHRGAVGILSTSQFISVFIVLFAVFMFVMNRRRPSPSVGAETDAEDAPAEE